jgi:hypothetical protein
MFAGQPRSNDRSVESSKGHGDASTTGAVSEISPIQTRDRQPRGAISEQPQREMVIADRKGPAIARDQARRSRQPVWEAGSLGTMP